MKKIDYDDITDEQLTIAAIMVLTDFPALAINFFVKIYPEMLERKIMTASEMAEIYGCTLPGAMRHVNLLTARGYLTRIHYRGWALAKETYV